MSRTEEVELKSSDEGEVFWYPLSDLPSAPELIDGFADMLPVFTSEAVSEVYYADRGDSFDTVFC